MIVDAQGFPAVRGPWRICPTLPPGVSSTNTFAVFGGKVYVNSGAMWWAAPIPPFVPTSIPGCMIWLNADDMSQADGTALSQWDDKSGQSNHAVQATGSKQPLLKIAVVNGHNSVRFDGSDDNMTMTVAAPSQPNTMFVVGVLNDTPLNQVANAAFVCFASSTGKPVICVRRTATSWGFWGPAAGGLDRVTQEDLVSGVWNILEIVSASSSSTILYRNGVARSGTFTVNPDGGGVTNQAIGEEIGFSPTRNLKGDIAEIIVYNSALSAADRGTVEIYLANKYNIPLVL